MPGTDHQSPPALPLAESRHVPLWWWFIIAFFVGSIGVAFGWYLGIADAVAVVVLSGAVCVWVLVLWSRGPIRIDEAGLQVGNNRIEWQWAGTATALDAAEARRILGVDADPRAFLQVRPWLHEAVRIEIEDPADPHPYWLVGTRDADRLMAAIDVARPTPVEADGGHTDAEERSDD